MSYVYFDIIHIYIFQTNLQIYVFYFFLFIEFILFVVLFKKFCLILISKQIFCYIILMYGVLVQFYRKNCNSDIQKLYFKDS